MTAWLQFPEAVIGIRKADPLAGFSLTKAQEDWATQETPIRGDVPPNRTREPLQTAEHTGLWLIGIDTIPAHGAAMLELVSTVGAASGWFGKTAEDVERGKEPKATLWHLDVRYTCRMLRKTETPSVIVPICYDRATRTATLEPPQPFDTPRVKLIQARGLSAARPDYG
jgi:hypothetical protein